MTDQANSHRGTPLLIIGASVVVVLWGIYLAQSVLVLFLSSSHLSGGCLWSGWNGTTFLLFSQC